MDSRMSGPPGGPAGFRLAGFPKEFERNFWETLDVRYYSIFLVTFILFYGFAFYVSMQDWSLSEDQIQAMKNRAIQKIYQTELIEPEEDTETDDDVGGGTEDVAEDEPEEVSEKGKERVEESQSQRAERRQRTQEDLAARSRQMQQEVGSQGILAIATSAGGAGAGNVAYSDVLSDLAGGAGGVGDIGEIVEGTTGIRAAGAPGERTRAAKGSGFRQDGDGTGIDDMIAGSGVSDGTSSFKRRGKIQLASENVKLTGGAGKRDSESITASINQQKASVEYCYQKRAKINPNLKGRIDLEVEIAPDGKVRRARVLSSKLGDKKLDNCIVRAVKRWRFGAVDNAGIVKVRLPFIF